ncbi:MAG TPA: hypothetical protein VK155_20135 [Bacteroidales bacterium]|jgi:hypothetical protein|nr:hypothetical protein [Bacteroidales bacterium]
METLQHFVETMPGTLGSKLASRSFSKGWFRALPGRSFGEGWFKV